MSYGESPTYAASAGSAPRRSSASSSGSGSGFWRSVSSPPTIDVEEVRERHRANASSTVERRFAETMPSRRPSSLQPVESVGDAGERLELSWSGSLCSR